MEVHCVLTLAVFFVGTCDNTHARTPDMNSYGVSMKQYSSSFFERK